MNILNNDNYKCKVGHKNKEHIVLSCGKVESFTNFFESALNSSMKTKISFSKEIELKCDCVQGSHRYPLSELTKMLQEEISRTNLKKCINHNSKRIHVICKICNEELCEQCAMFHRLKCMKTNIIIKNRDETLSKIIKSECHLRDEIYKEKEKMLSEIDKCIEALMTLKRKVECNYDIREKENNSFFNYLKGLYHYTSYSSSFPSIKDIYLMDDTSFIVKDFKRLTKITIQDSSCKKVRTFLLSQLPALTMVIIGKECFNNLPNWGSEIALDRSASAEVSDCQSLQVLSMDSGSFVAYGGIKLNSILIL